MIDKRTLKTGALAVAMTVIFAIFAFRAADWTKGLSSEFIVHGQSGSGSGGGGGATTKVLSQIVAGNYGNVEPRSYGTIIEVVNPGAAPVTVAGNFYSEDGSASRLTFKSNLTTIPSFTGSFSSSLPAGNVLVIQTGTDSDTSPANATASWGKITSTGTTSVTAFFELRNSANKALAARVGVPAGRGDLTSFVIPRVRLKPGAGGVDPDTGDAEIETGFAIVNTGSSPAAVNVAIKDATGTTIGKGIIPLPPNGHVSDFFFDTKYFSLGSEAATRQYQYAVFTSSSPTIGATALSIQFPGFQTSFPVDVLQ